MSKLKLFNTCIVLAVIAGPGSAAKAQTFGPTDAEASPARHQEWLVPTQKPDVASHATLFRPQGEGPFPLAIIAHASTQNPIRRAQQPLPGYRNLALALVSHGYAVLVPERPGHGVTGGSYLEDQNLEDRSACGNPDYRRAAQSTADSIAAALTFMRSQPWVRKDGAVIVGHSAGGWGALAMAGRDEKGIASVIVFAPGRGGHADDQPGKVCAPDTLISAAASLGAQARVRVTWFVVQNDSYFPPELSRRMANAFQSAGRDKVDFQILPPFGSEGHFFAEAADEEILNSLFPVELKASPGRAITKE